MAKQDIVRALVPHERADDLRERLLGLERAEVASVAISAPDPATYREPTSDLRLRHLIRYGWWRLLLGAVLGAAIGAALALLVAPGWAIFTVPLLAFGGAWGGAVTSTARGVQVAKAQEPPDVPDRKLDVDSAESQDLRVLTIVVLHDRQAVVDLLDAQDGVRLLDAEHPKVGRGPEARPEGGEQDER